MCMMVGVEAVGIEAQVAPVHPCAGGDPCASSEATEDKWKAELVSSWGGVVVARIDTSQLASTTRGGQVREDLA